MTRPQIRSIFLALLAAVLFGVSAPLGKLLLGEIDPIPLAAFLYLGSGFGLLLVKLIQRTRKNARHTEAGIQKTDWKWLAGATLAGGVTAPILLLFGLRHTPAATASLLLNFEGVATTLIAALVFKEFVSRRAWWAILMITLASILLSLNFNSTWGFSIGALGILAACLMWGLDNNFTRNISAKDPIVIVMVKGLGAGTFSLFLAWVLQNPFPPLRIAAGALLLGSISYGLSITLFILALRGLGAARTSALFATAPLAGIALSYVLFRENTGILFLLALPLMAAGTAFLVYEKHEHRHTHEAFTHDHAHMHDDGHHDHAHQDAVPLHESHSHEHQHTALQHDHAHMPDIHHRHQHDTKAE